MTLIPEGFDKEVAQKMFNDSYLHLKKQGKAWVMDKDGGSCVYQSADGNSCAVGCLLQEGEYDPKMEGLDVGTARRMGLIPGRLIPYVQLLANLQRAHDFYLPTQKAIDNDPDLAADLVMNWKYKLKEAAARFELDSSIIYT